MFCRNCGNEVQEDAIGCMKCGCDPYDGENFCPACGASINEKQVVCTQCGMTLRDSDWDSDRNSNNSNMNSKKGMFCRNCGNEVPVDAIGCIKCGCDPYDGENFCPACGASVNEKQVVCTQCGIALRDSDWDSGRNSNNSNMNSKKGMFCRNCGNEVSVDAVACMKCGCSPHEGKSFCPSCGAKTSEKQIVCIKCGIDLRKDDDWDSNRNSNNSYKKPGSKHKVTKDRISAALLAIFLGEIGGHQFYLGNAAVGWIRLIIFAVASIMYGNGVANAEDGPLFVGGLTFFIMQVICLIEGIKYLTMSEEDFDETYVQNKRGWF